MHKVLLSRMHTDLMYTEERREMDLQQSDLAYPSDRYSYSGVVPVLANNKILTI